MVGFGKSGLVRAKVVIIAKKLVLFGQYNFFGQNWFYSDKVVVFGQNWLDSGKRGCIRTKLVLLGKE